MKKTFLFALGCLLLSACSNEMEEPISGEPLSPKEYTVSIGMTGEIVEVTETPMSKAGDATIDDLYGIQVYSCPVDGTTTKYTPYAYGLFTDVSVLNIKLLAGYKYQFKATMVVDGKEKLRGTSTFSSPFFINGIEYSSAPISTAFTFSDKNSMSGLVSCNSYLQNTQGSYSYNRPNTERFYGEVTDYVPTENGQVKISMGRASYKVKVVVTGDKFTEGKVKVTMAESPDFYVVYEEDKNNDHFEEDTYTFQYVDKAVLDKQYSEKVKTSFYWIKDNGTEIPLKTNYEFEFKRNKQTTITIKVDDTQENGVGVEAIDDDITLGDNYYIENGEVTDTPVDPEVGNK